ncbi:hypothetical protein [Teredinibacter turnerae]|uniref:hypothetical protein n=1 Tax=Teredinibacter turnerae TaxID=2426 RepID=UPI0030D5E230
MNIYAVRQDNYQYRDIDLHIGDIIDAFPERYRLQECMKFSEFNIAMADFWTLMKTEFLPGDEHNVFLLINLTISNYPVA